MALRETSRTRSSLARLFRRDSVAIAVLFAASVLLYLLLVRMRSGPTVLPDEFTFGNLAQSIAAGDGSLWRGVDGGQRSVYPYVLAPAWAIGDGIDAYRVAQATNVVLLSSIVVPVWLLARAVLGRGLAWIPTLATLVGVWMESSAKIMTESVALPLATLSLSALALFLLGRSRWWFAIVLVAAGAAFLVRAQLGVLLVIVAFAVLLDVLRRPRAEWKSALAERRAPLAAAWILVLAAGIAVLVDHSLLGVYGDLLDDPPAVTSTIRWTVDHLVALSLVIGVIPAVYALALGLTPAAWRDDRSGPVLAVLAPAVLLFCIEAGAFVAIGDERVIERYVFYAAPLVILAGVMAFRTVTWARASFAVGLLAAAALASHSPKQQGLEAGGVRAFFEILFGRTDLRVQSASTAAVAALIIVLGGLAVAAVALRDRKDPLVVGRWNVRWRKLAGVVAAIASVIVLLAVAQWQWHEGNRVAAREMEAYGDPSWVDRESRGTKTLVAYGVPPLVALWIEFFNKDIDRVVAVPPDPEYGPAYCSPDLLDSGALAQPQNRRCRAPNRRLVSVSLRPMIPTFRREAKPVQVAPAGDGGTIRVVTADPELAAVRGRLCNEGVCQRSTVTTWARRPGTLDFLFRGNGKPWQVEVGGRLFTVAGDGNTHLRVPVPSGKNDTTIVPSWQYVDVDTPVLRSVVLEEGSASTRLN